MEHIIQFGVNIDDNAIENAVIASATKAIIEKVEESSRRGWYGQETKLESIMRSEVKRVIEENKDEILNKAIRDLVRNMSRTKAVKDAVNATFEKFGDDGE